ncbi:MAG TPA: ELWxxDGT repeat protein, partial [Segetibacter sp.]
GNEVWRTDGSEGGTLMVKDINPGSGDGVGIRVQEQYFGINEFISLGSLTLFPANDGSGIELWKTDGTTGGTALVKDIESGLPGIGGSPSNLTAFNNKIYFTANTVADGAELWVTDGTTGGTNLVKDINPGNESSTPSLVTSIVFGNRLVFTATDADHGTELWSTDGTGAGTTLLKDIYPGKEGSDAAIFPDFRNATAFNFSGIHNPPFNGKAFLTATTKAEGSELWITDGTAEGTVLVKDVYPGNESGAGNVNYFYTQNTFFFQGENDATGSELWKSNGSADGTVLVQDINPGTGSSNFDFDFVFNNHLYITADDGDNEGNTPDLYIIDESVTLPVTLFNFAATVQQSKAVKLDWSTTNEINSSHFAIERSADGIHFSNIDKVNAAGNSGLQRRYGYVDPQPSHLNNPILYYRLKMVDKDGSYKYSSVLAVRFKESSFRFTFSPNPVQNQLSVVVAAGGSKSIALRITDASGKQVYQQTLSSSQSIAQQNINVAGWQKGIYVIQLITNNSTKTAWFVKQ